MSAARTDGGDVGESPLRRDGATLAALRQRIDFIAHDRSMHCDIEAAVALVESGELLAVAQSRA